MVLVNRYGAENLEGSRRDIRNTMKVLGQKFGEVPVSSIRFRKRLAVLVSETT
jgi:hypothetical protein